MKLSNHHLILAVYYPPCGCGAEYCSGFTPEMSYVMIQRADAQERHPKTVAKEIASEFRDDGHFPVAMFDMRHLLGQVTTLASHAGFDEGEYSSGKPLWWAQSVPMALAQAIRVDENLGVINE